MLKKKQENNLTCKQEDLEDKKNKKHKLTIKLKKLRDEIGVLKSDLKNIKEELSAYYHKLLNEGFDTRYLIIISRHEGLVWIIKAIWSLDYNIIPIFLPNFLDEKSIEYLFEVSVKILYSSQKKTLN